MSSRTQSWNIQDKLETAALLEIINDGDKIFNNYKEGRGTGSGYVSPVYELTMPYFLAVCYYLQKVHGYESSHSLQHVYRRLGYIRSPTLDESLKGLQNSGLVELKTSKLIDNPVEIEKNANMKKLPGLLGHEIRIIPTQKGLEELNTLIDMGCLNSSDILKIEQTTNEFLKIKPVELRDIIDEESSLFSPFGLWYHHKNIEEQIKNKEN